MQRKKPLIEKGTVAGCIGTGRPLPPNRCDNCRKHSDYTCRDVNIDSRGLNQRRRSG